MNTSQPSLTSSQATGGLALLAEAAEERRAEFECYNSVKDNPDTDDENDCDAPYFESFYNAGGSQKITEMTNFTAQEFHSIWSTFTNFISANYNVGRGRRSQFSGKDVLFMTMTLLKHDGAWDFVGKAFGISGPTFERTFSSFIFLLSDEVYHYGVSGLSKHWTFEKLRRSNRQFKNFPYVRYASDVTFQNSNRPSGNLQEAKRYFSGKHKLYGLKVEVSVLPSSVAIGCSLPYPGSVSDIDIFHKNLEWHEEQLEKTENQATEPDDGIGASNYESHWAVLTDKGYQGAMEFTRFVHRKKKPRSRELTRDEHMFNKMVASDRIIVENYFGRMCSLWGVLAQKYRWNEKLYGAIFRCCLGLTNMHVGWNPLRASDQIFYVRVRNRLNMIGEETTQKRARVQAKYRNKRRRRMEVQLRARTSSYYPSDQETQSE